LRREGRFNFSRRTNWLKDSWHLQRLWESLFSSEPEPISIGLNLYRIEKLETEATLPADPLLETRYSPSK
jgi:hypothetical protein